MDAETFAAWTALVGQLVAARTRLGLSQTGIARVLGCDQGSLSRWETLHTVPTVPHLIAWARSVGVDVKLEEL